MENNQQEENNKQERNTLQWLLCGSIGLYLVMVAVAFGVHLWVMLFPIKNSFEIKSNPEKLESSPEKLEKLVRDYAEKEVDRSYGRFFTQFNFAIFLIGTSVWILRQSVINQLKADVEKDGERLRNESEETIRKYLKQETDEQLKAALQEYFNNKEIDNNIKRALSLDKKLKAQLEKSRIVEELSIFIPPEEVFFQEQTAPKIQERLEKLVFKLEEHIKSHKELLSLTVDDYIKLGDALYCLENYEKAKEQYENATQEHPDAYRALLGIGNALLRQGEKQQREGQKEQADKLFNEAIEDYYKKAITINPYNFVAHVNQGLVYKRWKKNSEGLKEAIKCLDEAIKILPK
ncbi:MAG: tetratricopeptide repeat protein [Iphinoe sp. HA4291-MV1]|jgi:tetratricopeptide (TPR) repeat protein|nr:tetratricopeptide repeat protein [Iphinoe sp. HA4291-MV1]